MISQVQRSAAAGERIFGAVQPQHLLEQPDGLFFVKATQVGLPAADDLGGQLLAVVGGVGAGG